MKTSKLLIISGSLLFTMISGVYAQSGPPWVPSNFGYPYIFTGIDFPANQNTIGFAAGESLTYNGNGIVVKTTNGGNTWTQMWTGSGMGIEGSSFVDVNNGFIAGWPKFAQGWSGFGKTTDGGVTWTSHLVSNDIYFFTDVVFKDPSNGIIVGQTNFSAGVWTTNNGGTTWFPGTGIAGVPYGACYVSGDTYFLVDNAGHIQKSTNNGSSWTTVFSQPGVLFTGIDFFNDDIGMASGDDGVIVKTNDGGDTWTLQIVGDDIWRDFAWETGDNVFVCGTPEIVGESTNGGMTWQNSYPQSTGQSALYEIIFTADGHGFICGSSGLLLRRNPSCGAGFSTNTTEVCTGDSVLFTDQSWGNVTMYNWWFEGGTPSTSNYPDPLVVYNNAGAFDVRLIASNPWWTDTLVMPNYITVTLSPVAPEISADGYLLTSNTAEGNQWFRNGYAIPGATSQTYEVIQSGNYWDVVTTGNCSSDTSNNIYIIMTGMEQVEANNITVSPVPNQGRFTISGAEHPSSYELQIYNLLGSKIYTQKEVVIGGETELSVDLGDVPSGYYVLVLTNATGRITKGFVIF